MIVSLFSLISREYLFLSMGETKTREIISKCEDHMKLRFIVSALKKYHKLSVKSDSS